MTKSYFIKNIVLLCALTLVSCSEEALVGEGVLALSLKMGSEVTAVTTRTLPTLDELNSSCTIDIRNAEKKLLRQYMGTTTLPDELQLVSGSYSANATAGIKTDVAFDAPYYKGSVDFVIEKGKVANTVLPLYLENTVVVMNYSETAAAKFKSCTVKVASSKGALEFDKKETRAGFFILPSGETELDWELKAVTVDDIPYTRTGTIKNVKTSTKYTLNFDYQELAPEDGGMSLTINVAEDPIAKAWDIEVAKCPSIQRLKDKKFYSLDEPVNFSVGGGDDVVICVRTTSELKSLMLTCPEFQTLLGIKLSSFDVLTLSSKVKKELEDKGISYASEHDYDNDRTVGFLTFGTTFFKYFSVEEGVFSVELKAIDNNRKDYTTHLVIRVSNSVVTTEVVDDYNVWAKHVSLKAGVNVNNVDEGETILPEDLYFEYRRQGQEQWEQVPAQWSEGSSTMTATIGGLDGGTVYEYRAACLKQKSESESYQFTTESTTGLPNGGFEDWYKSGKIWMVGKEGANLFWDSGNHGSSTLNVNVTNYDESVLAPGSTGKRSIKMESQFVSLLGIGKFAAGNVFVGQYIDTDGTDGILGFGRKFVSRPSKLKGYLRYDMKNVSRRSDNAPAVAPAKGEPDNAHVYIAVGDWDNETGIEPPIIIKTSVPKLFDPTGPKVIAYGEEIIKESTDGMVPFEIELNYKDLTRKAQYIVVVATASRYGDYFTGGEGSTLWLDDLELIYE